MEHTKFDDSCLRSLNKQKQLTDVCLVDVPVTANGILILKEQRLLDRIEILELSLSEDEMPFLSTQFGNRIVIWELEKRKPLEQRRY